MNKHDKIIAVEFTAEEKRIIDVRLDSYHQNPKLGSPWEDVYKRICDSDSSGEWRENYIIGKKSG